jgi:uncharacterized protein (UPF0212 family)
MKPVLFAAAAVLGLTLCGCSQQTINSAKDDANHDIAVANQKADQVAADAKPDLAKLDLGARVSAALAANDNLKGSHIRVDASTHGVRLHGTVKTAEQKHIAAQVAKDTLGPGKSVDNELSLSSS